MTNAIELKTIESSDLEVIWKLAYQSEDKLWLNYDGPYFNDEIPSLEMFIKDSQHLINGKHRKAIVYKQKIIGTVNAYFSDKDLKKWLEVGISIFDSSLWNKGIGYQALKLWIAEMFDLYHDLPKIGLTTWSGNLGMMRLSEKLGLIKEAQIRQVRYYNNKYWDSVSYGILRTEWIKKSD